jgi:hypothetical protein
MATGPRRNPRRPGGVSRSPVPPSAAEARAVRQGNRSSQREAEEGSKRYAKGGMCRGTGKASRGGRYGKSG